MRSTWSRAGLLVLAPGLLLLASCEAMRPFVPTGCDDNLPPAEAKAGKEATGMALAHDLDHLEKHIDWYGSVTAKVPDVWGQARLTKHREQFEENMASELGAFNVNLQGSLSRSDQAYFANAVALSAAVQPRPPVVGRVSTTAPQTSQAAAAITNPVTAEEVAKLTSDPDKEKIIVRSDKVKLTTFGFKEFETKGIGLEPTLRLAQKKRYLDFLNQLRRENEGDDTADSPGYSLNLVRIPVSLLPGKRTDVGFGAEASFTLDPVLGDELLPRTFRTLVTNDLVAQVGFSLTSFLNDRPLVKNFMTPENKRILEGVEIIDRINLHLERIKSVGGDPGQDHELLAYLRGLNPVDRQRLKDVSQQLSPEERAALSKILDALKPGNEAMLASAVGSYMTAREGKGGGTARRVFSAAGAGDQLGQLHVRLAVPTLSFASGVEDKLPFPTSQILDVYGVNYAFEIAYGAHQALDKGIKKQGYAHLPDIQGYLKEEIDAAWAFLRAPECQELWQRFCTDELVNVIRTRKLARVQQLRDEYRDAVARISQSNQSRNERPHNELIQHSKTAALAWCLLVDAALLNARLIRDMKETASAKGHSLPGCGEGAWLPYFLPDPPAEARRAFNEYVKLRWPIRVFALDPVTQDQNLADTLSTRREMQLALAMAFTNGLIGARTMTRYVRRLEAEYETIALNRTQVGFSHGENVFGWRFYPRFQTPDTPSNGEVFFRDLLIGGPNRDALLRQRRLEPGQRECVAIVLMPSFVPYMTCDLVANWFPLTNPKHKVLDHSQAMKLSRTVKAIQTCGQSVCDRDEFREGDLYRLVRRTEQLASRLPMQTHTVQVPVINTLGGFAMFSNGTTDFAPELYGWYGAPGVSTKTTTTLFLVGDHFSPLRSQVIAGNKVAKSSLLSRQVMQVDVDPAFIAVDGSEVRIHVATPYGVTRELAVPVAGAAPAAAAAKEGYQIDPAKVTTRYLKGPAMDGKYYLLPGGFVPPNTRVSVKWNDALGVAPLKIKVRFGFTYNGCPFEVAIDGEVEDNKSGRYVLSDAQRDQLVAGYLNTVNGFGPFTDATNPLAGGSIKTASITVVPVDPGRAAVGIALTDQLEIAVVCGIDVPAKKKDEEKKDEEKSEEQKPKEKEKPAGQPLPPLGGGR